MNHLNSYLFMNNIARILSFLTLLFINSSLAQGNNIAGCSTIKLSRYGQWDQAYACAKSHNSKIEYKLVNWSKYKDPNSITSFREVIEFIEQNPHFPDRNLLISAAESKLKLDKSNSYAEDWFETHSPITLNGMKFCLNHMRLDDKKFTALVKQIWKLENKGQAARNEFLSEYGKYLNHGDHVAKLNHLISQGNKRLDESLLALVNNDYRALFKARLELLRKNNNLSSVLGSVPSRLRNTPELLHAEALWHRGKENHTKVARILLENDNINDIKSDKWFKIRSITALELLDLKEYEKAYNIAKSHNYKEPVNYADGEWLAGKIAYFYLKDYGKAISHFKNLKDRAKFSVSIAKGSYWVGMCAFHLGDQELARKYFTEGSKYPDNFYGQLAVTKIKSSNGRFVPSTTPTISQEDLDWLKNNELVRASHLYSLDNQYSASRKFIVSAVRSSDSLSKRYLLAKFGNDIKMNTLSVISSKESAHRGMFFVKYSYPILSHVDLKGEPEPSLVHSVIRQESEFHTHAKSGAGAMGLMQLINSTAKECARGMKIKNVTKMSLCLDPKLNVKLGSYYLKKLLNRYDGSYILAVAAYNAGEGNVNKWIKKYGDPRKLKNMDQVVEWIEKTPFYETRSYIQHVLSNLQIYRDILNSKNHTGTNNIQIALQKDLLRAKA